MVVGLVLGVAGLLQPGSVDATQHSASRSFSATSVAPGAEVVVTITAGGFGFGGQHRRDAAHGMGLRELRSGRSHI